jgi:hypothetical protein
MARFLLTGMLALAWSATVVADNKPNDKGQERRDNQRVNAARDDVEEAQKKLAEESREVREAVVELVKAQAAAAESAQEVAGTRTAVEQRHGERAGLDRALEAAGQAQAAYDAAAKPILTSLHATEKYQAARKTADEARARSQAAADYDPKVLEMVLAPTNMERDALTADSTAAKLKAALDERLGRVAAARTAVREAVENDSEVGKALGRLDRAKDAVDRAERKLADERAKALAAVRKLAQEQAQLRQAIANDKKNDGNNKKPPPKKAKKKK